VVDFCVTHGMCNDAKPVVGFEQPEAQLNFALKYMKEVQAKP
jgi:hypothetical protein